MQAQIDAIHTNFKRAMTADHSLLFTTDTGYFGRIDDDVENGDAICILFGCEELAALRPHDNGSYSWVSPAYVDDVMRGEFPKDERKHNDTSN